MFDFSFDWTIVVAIAFAAFMWGRLSNRRPKCGDIIAENLMSPVQKDVYATVCALNEIQDEFGNRADLTKHWCEKRFELPLGFRDPSDLLQNVSALREQIVEYYQLRRKPVYATAA